MLRGINVGGQKRISMNDLIRIYESLGFQNVWTCVQSGNVIFDSPRTSDSEIVDMIEAQLRKSLGLNVSVIIRDQIDISKIIKNNPLRARDHEKLHVTFLRSDPAELPLDEIKKAKSSAEEFSISGREVYLFCPDGYGRTKLNNSFFEKQMQVPATTRNWRTVNAFVSDKAGPRQ